MKEITEQTDACLVQMYREGNSRAGEILYLRYWPKARVLAEHYLKSQADAEDVAQGVLIRVILEKKLLAFKGQSQLWSWLYRITINACKSHLRKNRRMVDIDWAQEENLNRQHFLTSHCKDPEVLAIEAEECDQLQTAMEHLTPAYRDGIQAICLKQKSYTESAAALSVPVHTLGVRVMRAKAQLAKWLLAEKPAHAAAQKALAGKPIHWAPEAA